MITAARNIAAAVCSILWMGLPDFIPDPPWLLMKLVTVYYKVTEKSRGNCNGSPQKSPKIF
jgi:hypothetical protein